MRDSQEERWKDLDRFLREYHVPSSWPRLAQIDLADPEAEQHLYEAVKIIDPGEGEDQIGFLNEGIRLVRNKKTQRVCVEKRVNPSINILVREILLLQILNHPNIVKFVDGFYDRTAWNFHKAAVYLRYCDLGNAQSLIKTYHERNEHLPRRERIYIPEAFIWHAFRGLASALQYIHFGIEPDDRRSPEQLDRVVRADSYRTEVWPVILHRDIKPENVLFQKKSPMFMATYYRIPFLRLRKKTGYFQQFPKAVLADFGVAIQSNDPDWDEEDQWIGTIDWMPPELPKASMQSDIWAIGAVMLALCRQLVNGVRRPVPEEWSEGEEAWNKSREARKGIRDLGVGEHYSRELNEVVRQCLRFNSRNRPLAFKLVALINQGEGEARYKGYLEAQEFPPWAFKGKHDRLSKRRRKLLPPSKGGEGKEGAKELEPSE